MAKLRELMNDKERLKVTLTEETFFIYSKLKSLFRRVRACYAAVMWSCTCLNVCTHAGSIERASMHCM